MPLPPYLPPLTITPQPRPHWHHMRNLHSFIQSNWQRNRVQIDFIHWTCCFYTQLLMGVYICTPSPAHTHTLTHTLTHTHTLTPHTHSHTLHSHSHTPNTHSHTSHDIHIFKQPTTHTQHTYRRATHITLFIFHFTPMTPHLLFYHTHIYILINTCDTCMQHDVCTKS